MSQKPRYRQTGRHHITITFVTAPVANTGAIQIILSQVASSLGYSNVASVGNRLRSLKKRYGFPNFDGKFTAAGSKPTTSQPTEAPNGAVPTNGTKTETGKPAKRGRPARAKTTTTTSTTTNGTTAPDGANSSKSTTNGGKSKSSKRKRDDEAGEDASSGEQQAGPAKKAARREEDSTTAQSNGTAPAESATTSGKSVHFAPLPNSSKRRKKQEPPEVELSPPLDVEALTTSINKMEEPSERLYFVALETVMEARRERRRKRETPRSGIKLRFRATDA